MQKGLWVGASYYFVRYSTMAASALPRWEMAFLASIYLIGSIKVMSSPLLDNSRGALLYLYNHYT
jgi:hypothetical protein